ncbi:cysteine/glutathione ABC transporter ATP-binding protein/permease CydC, partial [Salmonella enterica subsp. enterica serovar Bareilly]|nr:cysteine/glutathione ABC transporter ATP-binding protein/permease CydC [Salmonella enterica subsp. enterica serovar Bareilly]
QHILALLRDIGRDRTMLIITHRLQGLEHMDTLCVMDGGQIAEQGSHDALLARRGRYYQFVNRIPVMTGGSNAVLSAG